MNPKQFRKFILLLKHKAVSVFLGNLSFLSHGNRKIYLTIYLRDKDEELNLPMAVHLPRITILPKEIFGLLLWLSLSKLFEFEKKFDQFDPFAFHYDVAKTNETW